MQNVLGGLALGLVLALCGAVLAQGGPVPVVKEKLGSTDLSSTSINSTAHTDWIRVPQHRCVSLEIDYSNSSATAVHMSCETSDSTDTANGSGFDIHKLEDDSTAFRSKSDTHVWRNPVSGDEKWTWTVCNLPHRFINCYFDDGDGAGDASDTVTVKHVRSYP